MSHICTPFLLDFPYNDDIQEFTIKYDDTKDKYTDLINFIETYQRRINIELVNPDTILETLTALTKINNRVYFKLNESFVRRNNEFLEKGLSIFYDFPAHNWDTFNSLLEANVSDIYITGEMGFYLEEIRTKIQDRAVNIRAILNLAQQDDPLDTNNPIKAFFVRPEDIDRYEKYIDTFEIFYDNNRTRLEILYKVYMIDKQWFGDLSEIITGLDIAVDNVTLIPEFALFRHNCGKKCYKNGVCNLCDRALDLSRIMQEKGLLLTPIADE